jgi:hypothetical protein
MNIIEPEFRYPTRAAIDSLAKHFDLPNSLEMQDWEWEVADYNRINEFVAEFRSDSLSDDEKFTLLEIIIQSFEESDTDLNTNDLWLEVLSLIEKNFKLHSYSVWYWSDCQNENNGWNVTPFMRRIYEKNV